ncbi:hypothetical protein E2C01_041767 [Portunus trituberculatus]|uniref:Uncharacterized protein n=1 Tax=Portunus trituberculatus TaxID=210409 RepID=A0A5B7FSK5_PORTR|nr:hypothetical protein [Portunus trituberculatus]
MLWEGGLSSVVDKHSYHVGPFFKTIGPRGDEVPRPRQPALALIVVPVGSREVADLARKTSFSGLSRKEDSPPQGPPTEVSCSGSSSEGRISAAFYSLLMVNVNPSFSYHALHSLLKAYGTVVRI